MNKRENKAIDEKNEATTTLSLSISPQSTHSTKQLIKEFEKKVFIMLDEGAGKREEANWHQFFSA